MLSTPRAGQVAAKIGKYLYGYRNADLPMRTDLPKIPPVKESLYVSPAKVPTDHNVRSPMATSLGCHVEGHAPFRPDLGDTESSRASAYYRLGRGMFKMNRKTKRSLKRFALAWAKKNLTPISSDVDLSVDSWLDKTGYDETQKKHMREVWEKMQEVPPTEEQLLKNKGFVKEEGYKEPKYFRNIYGPSDETKVALGPMFKVIEEEVFKHPAFIKHVPVDKRAEYIFDRLYAEGGLYMGTDHTCFEAGVSEAIMRCIEFPIYKYLAGDLPGFKEWFDLVQKDACTNYIKFRNWWMTIIATRLSGRMQTSLGNGLVNLITMKWVAKMSNAKIKAIVEGDDGLARIIRGIMDMSWYKQLGMIVKQECTNDLGTASFVGMVFGEDGTLVRDPYKFMVNFGWSTRQYVASNATTLKTLARSKALSALVETPGAPIVASMARHIERVTRDVHPKMSSLMARQHLNVWERERWSSLQRGFESAIRNKAPNPPSYAARTAVEKVFGVPIDVQLSIESYLDNKNDFSPLTLPNFDLGDLKYVEGTAKHWDRYVFDHPWKDHSFPFTIDHSYVAEMSF